MSFRFCLLLFCPLVVSMFWIAGCSSPHKVVRDSELLSQYHLAFFPKGDKPALPVGTADLYIDYSKSMHPAIQSSFGLLENILTIANRKDSRGFIVGDKLIPAVLESVASDPKYDLYAGNIDSYKQESSHLREPIKKIVVESREAVLVTDFLLEEGAKTILPGKNIKINFNDSNWAANYFDSWIRHGRAIEIYSRPCPRLSSSQGMAKVFYVFFTDGMYANPQSVARRVHQELPSGYAYNCFSKSDFRVFSDYKEKGDAEKGLGSELEFLDFQEEAESKFSYYQVTRDAIQAALSIGDLSSQKLVLENLYFENKMRFFPNPAFSMEVTDVTEGLSSYYEWLEDMESTEVTGRIDTVSYDRKGGPAGQAVSKMFEMQTVSETNSTEFRVSLLDPESLPFETVVYRLDFYLESAQLVMDEAKLQQELTWYWDKSNDVLMGSLSGSIIEAMKRNPLGKTPLYSIYLEISN